MSAPELPGSFTNQSEERIGREAPPEARPPAESRAEEKQEEMLEREAGAHEKGRSGQDVKSEESEIHNFAQAGDVEGVRRCLVNGYRVDEQDELGCTPVHLAGAMGHTNVVRFLVQEHGAAVDARDGALCTSLHAASEGGHPDMVVLLLRLGAKINARNRNRQTPLHYACGYGQTEAVHQLTAQGASLGARDVQGNTPLHLACARGGADIVRLLLSQGSALDAFNCRRRSPLHLACRAGNTEAAVCLLEHGADPIARDSNGMQPSDAVGARRPMDQGARLELLENLERYQLGEYAGMRAPTSSMSSMRRMWMERDNDNTSPSQGQGNLDNSAAIGSGGMGGAAGGPNLGLGPGGGGGIPGMLGGGGGGGGGDFGGSRSGAGSGRHGTSAEWEMGNAVAGRLDEMRARELGASLRATVQENEAMRRNLEFAQEQVRVLQQKVSQQALLHQPSSSKSVLGEAIIVEDPTVVASSSKSHAGGFAAAPGASFTATSGATTSLSSGPSPAAAAAAGGGWEGRGLMNDHSTDSAAFLHGTERSGSAASAAAARGFDPGLRAAAVAGEHGGSIAERVARGMYGTQGVGGLQSLQQQQQQQQQQQYRRQQHLSVGPEGRGLSSLQAVREAVEVAKAAAAAGDGVGKTGREGATGTMVDVDVSGGVGGGGGGGESVQFDGGVVKEVGFSQQQVAAPFYGGSNMVNEPTGGAGRSGPVAIEAVPSGGGSSAEQPVVSPAPEKMSQLLIEKKDYLQSLLDKNKSVG